MIAKGKILRIAKKMLINESLWSDSDEISMPFQDFIHHYIVVVAKNEYKKYGEDIWIIMMRKCNKKVGEDIVVDIKPYKKTNLYLEKKDFITEEETIAIENYRLKQKKDCEEFEVTLIQHKKYGFTYEDVLKNFGDGSGSKILNLRKRMEIIKRVYQK